MKQKNELGSFENAVTCGDAAWLTRGYHSQNATYTLRNYQTGGLLYYKHFSQRGNNEKNCLKVHQNLQRDLGLSGFLKKL